VQTTLLPSTTDLRQVMGRYPTGVTVVTTTGPDGRPLGFTANSFTSVSLDPALILLCVGHHAGCHDDFVGARHFAVNILAQGQHELARIFATKGQDRFAQAAWQRSAAGSPLLEATAAWLDCATHDVHTAGDHTILIGRVLGVGHSDRASLAFYAGGYASVCAQLPLAA